MREVLLRVQIQLLPEGVFLATSDELPGLLAQGRTVTETLEIAQDVARALVESYIDHNEDLPQALCGETPELAEVSIPVTVP